MTALLLYALVYAGVLTAFVLATLAWFPRLWIQDLPPELKEQVPAKTPAERRLTLWLGIPLFAWVLLAPAAAGFDPWGWGLSLSADWPLDLSWAGLAGRALVAYVLNQAFNLADWLLIDGLVVCGWAPKALVPPTLTRAQVRDFGFHTKGWLKGWIVTLPLSLASAALGHLAALVFSQFRV